MKLSTLAAPVVVLLVLSGCLGRSGFEYGCEAADQNCVNITFLDYRPQTGTYDIHWPSPRQWLTYSDVKHFVLDLEIDRPAPSAFSITFDIEEDRWSGWDTLGKLTASFPAGATRPTITYAARCCGAERAPTGTPDPLVGTTFWMGCTKAGRIRGNGPHGDDGHASIRLKRSNTEGSVSAGNRSKTVAHTVRCT